MSYITKYVDVGEVEVDIDMDEILDDLTDDELLELLQDRNLFLTKDRTTEIEQVANRILIAKKNKGSYNIDLDHLLYLITGRYV